MLPTDQKCCCIPTSGCFATVTVQGKALHELKCTWPLSFEQDRMSDFMAVLVWVNLALDF